MALVKELEKTFDALQAIWPPRSLSGAGTRASHDILEAASGQKFTRIEVKSGEKIFDWVCPPEWRLHEAYCVDPEGRRIMDARINGLHILGYSTAVNGKFSRHELEQHLHSDPLKPDAIVYKTAYYSDPPTWGFCISQRARDALPDGDYTVCIDAEFINGSLPICELVLPGTSDREILLWAYSCHPVTMAHHDLSANLAWAFLARRVAAWKDRRYTYRFVIGPETIGSLAYLARLTVNWYERQYPGPEPFTLVIPDMSDWLKEKCDAGYVMTCLGRGAWNYKRSRRGDTLADRAVEYVLRWMPPFAMRKDNPKSYDGEPNYGGRGKWHKPRDFYANMGSDELQFCSQGFNLPVGSLMRLPYGEFEEYHTDQDNRDFISFDTIADSIDVYERVLLTLEANRTYRATITHGMPQLGRRGLYDDPEAITPLVQFSDGTNDLLAIAKRTGFTIERLSALAARVAAAGVLEEV